LSKSIRKDITIRPEIHKDYKDIICLVLRSFKEGTPYSDGTDIVALIEEIRYSKYYIPELSFVAELDNKIVGHFLFSHFPLSPTADGGHKAEPKSEIVMLAPVSVHADYFKQGIGSAMLAMGIEKVKELGYRGITVEGNFNFYNRIGFKTSSDYGIYPTSGYPMTEPKCMMCQETFPGSLDNIKGYVVYDMYYYA
jgi:putative acetyltransferase